MNCSSAYRLYNAHHQQHNAPKRRRICSKSNTLVIDNIIVLLLICLVLIFCLNLIEGVPTPSAPMMETVTHNDLLCNLGDEYECICNRSKGNLDNSNYIPCYNFLEVKELDVVKIVLRDINLSLILHTNESYEQYLRRRIANILSQYCENMPSECPGTLADIRTKENAYLPLINLNNKTTAIIYDEPIFSRRNVIILRVTYPTGRSRVEVAFAVIKKFNTISLNRSSTLNPIIVKYILSAQMAPLSRVLGGIQIEQFGIDTFEKPVEPMNNTKLLIMITMVSISMLLCCTAAAVRQLCLLRQARKDGQNKASVTGKKGTRNYGTCTDKLHLHSDQPNGHANIKAVCSLESNSSRKMKKQKTAKFVSEVPTSIAVEKAQEVSPRSYQNIFICDHSQLPKEAGDEEFELEIQRSKKRSLNVRSPRSPFSSDEDASGGGFFEGVSGNGTQCSNAEIPSVVLDEGNRNANGCSTKKCSVMEFSEDKYVGLLSTINENHPFERPLSRRGSLNEEIREEGEEEAYNDTREETPVPLGDDRNAADSQINALNRRNNKEIGMIICDGSGSEESNAETYNGPMNQALKGQQQRNSLQSCNNKIREFTSSDSEEMKKDENGMLDRHQYERLLESPIPEAEE